MANKLRIGLVQMRSEKGAVTENLTTMRRHIDKADEKGIDVLGFPEASISGFANPTGYPGAVLRLDGPEIQSLVAATEGRRPFVLAGFIEASPQGLPFITQAVISDGKLVGCHRKTGFVDKDGDWFRPGVETASVFSCRDITFGIAICSEIVSEDVFAACARQGAQIVFELAAPGLHGAQATRNWESGFRWWEGLCLEKLSAYSRRFGMWIAVATQAGRTIDEDFPGGGYIFSPKGERVLATPDWSEGVVYSEIDFAVGVARWL